MQIFRLPLRISKDLSHTWQAQWKTDRMDTFASHSLNYDLLPVCEDNQAWIESLLIKYY